MEADKLAELLRTLREAGVLQYSCGDLSVTFAAAAPVLAQGNPEQDDRDLELPGDVVDPRKKLAEIYKRNAKRAA